MILCFVYLKYLIIFFIIYTYIKYISHHRITKNTQSNMVIMHCDTLCLNQYTIITLNLLVISLELMLDHYIEKKAT